MHTDPTHIAICAEYATRQPGPPIGPCVLRPQHQGRIHQDVRGVKWSTPAPAAGGVVEDALTVVGETADGCDTPLLRLAIDNTPAAPITPTQARHLATSLSGWADRADGLCYTDAEKEGRLKICAARRALEEGRRGFPCVPRKGHRGQIHEDVSGEQWPVTPSTEMTTSGIPGIDRTPVGQGTRTRTGTPDSRTQDRADTALTRADSVRAAINRAFGIPAGRTPDTPGQDTTRTRSATARADTGRQDEHGM